MCLMGCGRADGSANFQGAGENSCDTEPSDAGVTQSVDDELAPMRRLRRMTLALTDRLPTRERLYELNAITDPSEQEEWLDVEADRLLTDSAFYDAMVEFGHMWMNIPAPPTVGVNMVHPLIQQSFIVPCPEGTLHAGQWTSPNNWDDNSPCNGVSHDGTPPVVRHIEPWWAEGTTIEVLGQDGEERAMLPDANGRIRDCGSEMGAGVSYEQEGGCGCGPHLAYCVPAPAYSYARVSHPGTDLGNRRRVWDEPARLLAHLAWHDRPLTDLISGTYSVGPVGLQATYVRYGRRLGATSLDEEDSWWRTSRWSGVPHDPHHEATDPDAWSEFEIPTRNPFLLADRNYHFDPRTEPRGTMRGVPAAGVMTMPGVLAAYTRERIRGARFLEIFACENFVPPPPTAHFEPYTNDPATGGPCMHCHSRIDPASIHFKRFTETTQGFEILGVGDAHPPDAWVTGQYPYQGEPWGRMRRLWAPGLRISPIDEATEMRELEARYIDFLPPDQSLFGRTSDGTVGPLGVAKILIDSGAFDRCAVRRLHERFVGRDVDPTAEAGYLQSLVATFVENERQIRPFVRHLFRSTTFRRGL